MSKISVFFVTLFMFTQFASAQFLNQTPPPQVVKNPAGQNVIFDYALPLKGITTQDAGLQKYQDRPVLFFYFSALCPHCKTAFPKVQKIHDEFKDAGLQTVAIAVSNNSRIDVLKFGKSLKATVPFLQDASRKFGEKYGVGHVPMIILVNPDGSYIVYDSVDAQLEDLKTQLKSTLGK